MILLGRGVHKKRMTLLCRHRTDRRMYGQANIHMLLDASNFVYQVTEMKNKKKEKLIKSLLYKEEHRARNVFIKEQTLISKERK